MEHLHSDREEGFRVILLSSRLKHGWLCWETLIYRRAGEILRSIFLGQEKNWAQALLHHCPDGAGFEYGRIQGHRLNCNAWAKFNTYKLQNAMSVTAGVVIIGLMTILIMPYQEKLAFNVLHKLPLPEPRKRTNISLFDRNTFSTKHKRAFMFGALTIVIWLINSIENAIECTSLGKARK